MLGTSMDEARAVHASFTTMFGPPAAVYRAPGRVNLIGEHTDYNQGFVLPVAIDLGCWVAGSPRDDNKLIVYSDNFAESAESELGKEPARRAGKWWDYPLGVAWALQQSGYRLRGTNLYIRGNVPIGAGLSSSAAIEVCVGYALLDLSGHAIDRTRLALSCQRAENEFVGMRCGIMDQFIACFGRADCALMLDCRSLEYELAPVPREVRLVVCNTMVKHELAASEYNVRREQCEAGVRFLASRLENVSALRDVSLDQLMSFRGDLTEVVFKRCRHVISENARVEAANRALKHSDLAELGRLMAESHRSLRDDYAVSCAELDSMVELASGIEGCIGSRMTGGGFGGCTINLVDAGRVGHFADSMAAGYERSTGKLPEIYVCSAADAASEISA